MQGGGGWRGFPQLGPAKAGVRDLAPPISRTKEGGWRTEGAPPWGWVAWGRGGSTGLGVVVLGCVLRGAESL